jgi:hypothetical protein
MHYQLFNLHWWSNHTHLRDILSIGRPDGGAAEGKDHKLFVKHRQHALGGVGGDAIPRLIGNGVLSRTWLAYLACVFDLEINLTMAG